ncbi:MAG: TetR/AcrR family transcriptional regulator [Alphaproteobacteria bacterium]|jgi:TetR/AcrR family transcriptional regulator, cholesterol catabolism regulator|nr:TetR/AcrR family transcriptional regulator [Alphaproteobacteria bacterium]MBT4086696.1 TetR/AcrR family transcriptional regulator [Alphaproteobacteria bacterium]MBT4546284.1 TetR/AcrR family transcriptional regulator [Alphaproteobacteria bacterium]MBT5161174.1 TetR/AcrR family transcriptional regulator [Alphaproteobacteria bacterium]MBT5919849.1 TetR/AcrR family transcriptional regulator [Alphaproteobacteria bacterium]
MKKAEATRLRILDTAARLFRQNGYAAVSLRGIAAAEKMQGGSLYYHFRSKEEIITDVLNIGIEIVHRAVDDALAALPPTASHDTRIRTAMEAHLQALLEHSDYTSANVRIFGQVPKAVQKANLKVRRAYEECWSDILAAAQKAGAINKKTDLHIVRLMLIGTMNATLEWFDPKRGTADKLAAQFADNILNGILIKPENS